MCISENSHVLLTKVVEALWGGGGGMVPFTKSKHALNLCFRNSIPCCLPKWKLISTKSLIYNYTFIHNSPNQEAY